MSEYRPDSWVIVKVYEAKTNNTIYRILGSWYGGYLGSDSWRLSSPIVKITDDEEVFIVWNESGSVYYLRKGCVRMSGFTSRVYVNFQQQLERLNDGSTIEIVDITEVF